MKLQFFIGVMSLFLLSDQAQAAAPNPTGTEQTVRAGSNINLTLTNLKTNDQIAIWADAQPVGTVIATSSTLEITIPIPGTATPGQYIVTTQVNEQEPLDHLLTLVSVEEPLASWRTQLIILFGILMVLLGAGFMLLHADHRPLRRHR